MQQLRLHAQNTENESEDGAAHVEQQLAGIDDATREVIPMSENARIIDRFFQRLKHIAIQPRAIAQIIRAGDRGDEEDEAENPSDSLVAREGTGENAERDE